MVVNGAYRGLRAIMERLNEKSFSVAVRIDQVVCVCVCVCVYVCVYVCLSECAYRTIL